MAILKSLLFVAFNDPSTATYSLIQYNLETQTREDHLPGDDHQDQVTGLGCCPELGLVATSGRDRKVRIWNQHNQLLRTLCLNDTPQSLAFSKGGAELLLGVRTNVYRINLSRLLPMSYQLKLQAMFLESSSLPVDPPIPILSSALLAMSEEDRRRLTQTHSILSSPGVEVPRNLQESKEKSEEYTRLCTRDQELQLLLEGRLEHSKKTKISKKNKRDAMERYLQLLYRDIACIKKPEIGSCDPDDLLMPPIQKPKESPFIPFSGNKGFFSDSALGPSIQTLPQNLQVSFQAFRSLPNSAVLQMLLPMELLEKKQKVESRLWRRLELFQGDVTSNKADPVISGSRVSEEEDEGVAGEEEELMENEAILRKISQFEVVESLLPSLDASSDLPLSVITNVDEKEKQDPRPPATQVRRMQRLLPSRLPRPRTQPQRITSPIHLDHPVLPLSSEPVVLEKLPSPTIEVSEPRENPLLPFFILQFQGNSWFPSIFPKSQIELHPVGEKGCVSRLLQSLLHSGHPTRAEILQALKTLFQQGHLKNSKETRITLIQAINPAPELNLQMPEDEEFVFSCLSFMVDLFPGDKDLIIELLVLCVKAPPAHRTDLFGFFTKMGVQDPHDFLKLKMKSWDNWERTNMSRDSLRHQCAHWLEEWTSQLKDHVSQSLQALQDRSWAGRPRLGGARILKGRLRASESWDHSTFEVTPVEVLNYYCEVQMMSELQTPKEPHKDRSTVLALPPINRQRALLRLGEMDVGLRPRAQENGFLPCVVRPLQHGIIPFINLPLKKVSIFPFTTALDPPAKPYLTGSLKQDIHRYFIVQRSYANSHL